MAGKSAFSFPSHFRTFVVMTSDVLFPLFQIKLDCFCLLFDIYFSSYHFHYLGINNSVFVNKTITHSHSLTLLSTFFKAVGKPK